MTIVQPDLFSSVTAYHEPRGVTGHQHVQVLEALLEAGQRGLTGEECADRCGFRDAHIATSRMNEMAAHNKRRSEAFPVALVYRSERRERPTASGVKAYVYWLTDVGRSWLQQTGEK